MSANYIDIASKVDVEQFYRDRVDRFKKVGRQATARCPFHEDRANSFSINLSTGQSQCFAGCGRFNMVTFEAKLRGSSNEEVFKQICEDNHIELKPAAPQKAKKKEQKSGYTVAQYAEEKGLNERLLRMLQVKDGENRIEIPYANEEGTIVRVRYRMAGKQFKWNKGEELCLYGLWRMEKIRNAGYVVLVEGESDAQTLIQLGLPVLGVPGATTMKPEWAACLDGLDVILHDEGDGGAEAFKAKVGEVIDRPFRTFKCLDIDPDCKDPNALMIKLGEEEAKAAIEEAIEASEEFTPKNALPKGLTMPEGYAMADAGIIYVGDEDKLVTSTIMYLSAVIRCSENGTEKTELTYSVNGRTSKRIFERDVILSSRTIVSALAPLGINVSSENASGVVRYLSDFDAVTHDALPLTEATPRLGWAGKAYVPYDSEIAVDDGIDDRKREYLDGFLSERGTLAEWVNVMEPHRANHIFRFVTAASFASPLLQLLGGRVFIVYNWASSRSGKTAALKAAMSVWGDPDGVVSTFNGTQNAIESIAGFFNNMPLAIDERQMRVGKGAQDALDQLIYTLSSGRGKDRSTRGGGLRSAEHWRNVVLSTGEVPISGAASQTGVLTRTLEIEGSPFSYNEDSARGMHEAVRTQHGTAGRVYIEALQKMGVDGIRDLYERMRGDVLNEAKGLGSVSSHIDSACMVATADYIASVSVFGYSEDMRDFAWSMAVLMAAEVLKSVDKETDIDNAQRALDVILDWIATNADKFTPNDQSPFTIQGRLGERKHGGFALIGTRLREELERHGFNVKQVVKQLGDRGYFEKAGDGTYTSKMMVGGSRVRCYFLNKDPKEAEAEGRHTYFDTMSRMEEVR